jgi:F-type H+-transporting ATPase subunit alpha
MEEQVVSLFSGVNGFLDEVKIQDVVRFEQMLLDNIREKGIDILSAIRTEEAISEETEKKLKNFIGDFVASFS